MSIKFRTGPHMGIPYQEARALGLSSALKGPEFYENYKGTIKVTTPSQRMLKALEFPKGLGMYKANRPTLTLRKEIMLEMERVAAPQCSTDYIMGLLKACAESFKLPREWTQALPFTVLKPARKEKPE